MVVGLVVIFMNFKATHNYQPFFDMLPPDWQRNILPFWDSYKHKTTCYVLHDNNEIVAGGLVFSECSPDMLYAKEEADYWLKKGYLYLGFIFVLENRRGQNLGSLWLTKLKDKLPNQNFWLTIEDLSLDAFYSKNGFKRVKTLHNGNQEEVLYTFEASKL